MSNSYQDQMSVIEKQEASLVLPSFSNDVAFQLGTLIRSNFLAQFDAAKDGIVVSVQLFSGHILFACAAGNPKKLGPDNWDWVRRKLNTVKRYGRSSFYIGRKRLLAGEDLDGLGPEYAAHGGAFPLHVQNMGASPVGAVIVSGLSQEDDHKLVVAALEQLIQQLKSQK